MDPKDLNKELGNADLLLIDQILKNRFSPELKILDAGCGEGRNMVYFIKNGYQIYGIDQNREMVSMAQLISQSLNKNYARENIIESSIEENPFPENFFDIVLCINVLHIARDINHFKNMIKSMVKILKSGGLFYMSMESNVGIERKLKRVGHWKYELENNEIRFLLTNKLVEEIIRTTNLVRSEPMRTIHIENMISYSGVWFKKTSD